MIFDNQNSWLTGNGHLAEISSIIASFLSNRRPIGIYIGDSGHFVLTFWDVYENMDQLPPISLVVSLISSGKGIGS